MEPNKDSNKKLFLLCVDESEHSLHAFDWYQDYIHRNDHSVALVHVYAPAKIPSYGKHNGNPFEVSSDEVYKNRVQKVTKKRTSVINSFQNLCTQRGIKPLIYTEERIDSVGHRILKVAEETNATCIVMGQGRHGAIRRTIFGSTSEYVLHHAHATVVIVPQPKHH